MMNIIDFYLLSFLNLLLCANMFIVDGNRLDLQFFLLQYYNEKLYFKVLLKIKHVYIKNELNLLSCY